MQQALRAADQLPDAECHRRLAALSKHAAAFWHELESGRLCSAPAAAALLVSDWLLDCGLSCAWVAVLALRPVAAARAQLVACLAATSGCYLRACTANIVSRFSPSETELCPSACCFRDVHIGRTSKDTLEMQSNRCCHDEAPEQVQMHVAMWHSSGQDLNFKFVSLRAQLLSASHSSAAASPERNA